MCPAPRSPLCVLLAVTLWQVAPASAAEVERCNIISIVTDDQALWTLGAYGNPEVRTPHLDRLAVAGAKFTNAFVPTPV